MYARVDKCKCISTILLRNLTISLACATCWKTKACVEVV